MAILPCLGVYCRGSAKPNEAEDAHTCPFAVEIGGDTETLCECCEQCEQECCADV
jgi:hypothetical protein